MQVTVNKKKFDVPFSLEDITLKKFIEYYNEYGRDLDKRLGALQKRDYKKMYGGQAELQKQIDLDNHLDNEAISWYSFWTGLPLKEAKGQAGVQALLTQYRILKYLLIEDEEKAKNFPVDVEWNGETWSIQNYTVNAASNMTFNEIITSKEIMRQISSMELGKWDAMPYLCSVFFRKKGEAFTDKMVEENSERTALIMDLPMNHVLKVSFFLIFCAITWKNTSQYSHEKAVSEMLN